MYLLHVIKDKEITCLGVEKKHSDKWILVIHATAGGSIISV